MTLENLTEVEILQGFLSLLIASVSIIIGSKIILKYFKLAESKKWFITVGFSYIFLSSGWWGASISFLFILFINSSLPEFWYIFLANAFIFLALICWLYSFFKFKSFKHNKLLWHISLIMLIFYEIFFIILFINNYRNIATMTGLFITKKSLSTLVFDIIAISTALITGVLFSIESLKSDNPKVVWKGRFLLSAFISFTIGAFFDAILPLDPIYLVIIRLFLISSAFEYYFGFFLPDKIANRLIK